MKNEITLQNIADFENKSLLIVDDDNPFRERLARAMEKRALKLFKLKVYKKG
jgi:two-component system response regulator RegA